MLPRPPKKNPYAKPNPTRWPSPGPLKRAPVPPTASAVSPVPAVAPAAPPASPVAPVVMDQAPAEPLMAATPASPAPALAQPEHPIFLHLTAAQVDFCRSTQSKIGVPANILAALALLFLGVWTDEAWSLLNQNGYARGFSLTPRAATLQRMVERGL